MRTWNPKSFSEDEAGFLEKYLADASGDIWGLPVQNFLFPSWMLTPV